MPCLRHLKLAAPPALRLEMDGRQQAAHVADALPPHALQPLQLAPALAVRLLWKGNPYIASCQGRARLVGRVGIAW